MWHPLQPANETRDIVRGGLIAVGVSAVAIIFAAATIHSPGAGLLVYASFFVAPIAALAIVLICIVPWYYLLLRLRTLSFLSLYITSVLTLFLCIEIPWRLTGAPSPIASVMSLDRNAIPVITVIVALYSALFVLFWFGSWNLNRGNAG